MKQSKYQSDKIPTNDNDVINQIFSGNRDAFFILQNKYKKVISSLIRRMIKDEDDIDDLTQETFIKAYNALPTFQTNYSFSSWIFRIASNTCIDFLRKKRFNIIPINQPANNSEEDQFIEIEDKGNVADSNMINIERKQLLLDAIESLPENFRTVIKLRHEEELDYKQISDQLNMPLGTVKAHLFRARKILLEKLKNQQYIFTDY